MIVRHSNVFVLICVLIGTAFLSSVARAQDCEKLKIDAKASQSLGAAATIAQGCHPVVRNGFPLPDARCTPGAINPTLTNSVMHNPEFRTGCVRDGATSASKKNSTYSDYSITKPSNNTGAMQKCELDHLVSLELGGADTLDNIWPQCGPGRVALRNRYFKKKDAVENYLAMRVRDGEVKLSDAQHGIATDWTQYLEEAEQACRSGKCK